MLIAEATQSDAEQQRLAAKLRTEQQRLQTRIEELEYELANLKRSPSWLVTQPLRDLKGYLAYLRSRLSKRRFQLQLRCSEGLTRTPEGFRRSARGAGWIVELRNGERVPRGWIVLRLIDPGPEAPRRFALYVDTGNGFSEVERITVDMRGADHALCYVPALARALRVDTEDGDDVFKLSGIEVHESFEFSTLCDQVRKRFRAVGVGETARRVIGALRRDWYRGLVHEFCGEASGVWTLRKAYEQRAKKQRRRSARVAKESVTGEVLFSVLVPVYNTPERWLRECVQSVLKQAYGNLELLLVDDASTRPAVKQVLAEAAARDPRVKVITRAVNGHISAATNTALDRAHGRFIVLLDHDDLLSPDALAAVAQELARAPGARMVFSDEDRVTPEGKHIDPVYKGGFQWSLFRAQNIVSHLGVYETARARRIGGFRLGFEGSQDWDFALRFAEGLATHEIRHVPRTLYHWRLAPGTVSFESDTQHHAMRAAERAVREHRERIGEVFVAAEQGMAGVMACRIDLQNPRSWQDALDLLRGGKGLSIDAVVLSEPSVRISEGDIAEGARLLRDRSSITGVAPMVRDCNGRVEALGWVRDCGILYPIGPGCRTTYNRELARYALEREWSGWNGACVIMRPADSLQVLGAVSARGLRTTLAHWLLQESDRGRNVLRAPQLVAEVSHLGNSHPTPLPAGVSAVDSLWSPHLDTWYRVPLPRVTP